MSKFLIAVFEPLKAVHVSGRAYIAVSRYNVLEPSGVERFAAGGQCDKVPTPCAGHQLIVNKNRPG